MASDREEIEAVIASINRAWLSKDHEAIGVRLAEQVVLAVPDSDVRVRGRAGYVQSYRDYDAAATTIEFETGDSQIDVIEDSAVALCPFRIVYELGGTVYRERGTDMLVLHRRAGTWLVVWRSMRTTPSE